MFHIDYETYSTADLQSVGSWRYAFTDTTEILCMSIAHGDDEPVLWLPAPYRPADYDPAPADALLNRLANSDEPVYAHNSGFEFPITEALWQKTTGLPKIAVHRWRCTAAMARKAALPHSLAKCAAKLGLAQQKDNKGSALIRKFSMPQKDGRRIKPKDDPEAFKQFCDYCVQDVRVEQEIHQKLKAFELTGFQLEVFQADLLMNQRGIPINLDAVRNAKKIVEEASTEAVTEFKALTGLDPTQVIAFREWLAQRGVDVPDLRAETIDELLDSDELEADGDAGRALELRRRVSFAATRKLDAFEAYAGPHDNKVRGILTYYGAVRTGRWSSSGPQIQNSKRPPKHLENHTDAIYSDIKRGASHEELGLIYGNPIECVASCIRHFVDDGKPMLNADYSAIEARVLAWLAGEQWRIEVFKTHGKIYEASIAQMLGIPLESVTKDLRQRGKVAELACIAEDELVLTDIGLVPIQNVTAEMRVWDGESFVNHQGVVYRGLRQVITYEGLTATEDHVVWTEEGTTTEFGRAASSGSHLAQTGAGRHPLRLGDNHKPSNLTEEGEAVRSNPMCRLRRGSVDIHRKLEKGGFRWVSKLFSTESFSKVVRGSRDCNETEVRQPKMQILPQLWRERDSIQVCLPSGGCDVDKNSSWASKRLGDRQDQQRGELRTGESSLRYEGGAAMQYSEKSFNAEPNKLVQKQQPVRGYYKFGNAEVREVRERSHRESFYAHAHFKCEVARHTQAPRLARVYDLVECGPNNRFTVSGVLVHNCGYGGGKGALTKMGALQMGVPESELQSLIDKWRSANPQIKSFWSKCEFAARSAINQPGQKYGVNGKVQYFCARTAGINYLFCRLPSGRCLAYPEPRIETTIASWNEPVEGVTYFGQHKGKQSWGRISTYGGSLVENITQAVAADIMAHGLVQCQRAGYEINALIHDEALAYYKPGQSVEEFNRLLTTLPDWATGLPLKAEGGLVSYYRKD